MKREIRKLFDRMARANGLNTRGRRAYRGKFARDYQQVMTAVQQTLSPFVGKPFGIKTRDAMVEAFCDAFAPPIPERIVETASISADGMMSITLTAEASRLLRAVTPSPPQAPPAPRCIAIARDRSY